MDTVLYIHGKGGSADEAEHYKPLFPSCDVLGLDYKSSNPWDVRKEIFEAVKSLHTNHNKIVLIANSIGAFFSMHSDIEQDLSHAYFISPIVDMEKLILNLMTYANVTEAELKEKQIIQTDFGEDLSWEYLSYVRGNPIKWNVTTDVLYGCNDNLTSFDTIQSFVKTHKATLTVMEGGEHWFHTEEQLKFLDNWIKAKLV